MNIYEITFSPTGGTQKAADLFTQALQQEATLIDLCDSSINFGQYSFTPDDICVVAVPAYGGRVPAIAVDRLNQMKGGSAKTILMAVYGNRHYDDTLLELKEVLEADGFHCIAAVAALAEHSIIRQFAAGRPDDEDAKELSGFAGKVKSLLESGNITETLTVPGNTPYKEYNGIPMKPKAGKKCNDCGICAEECPVNAIPADKPSETDESKCISCMRCISVCPNQARGLNKLMLAGVAQKLKKACSERKPNELYI